LGPATTGTLSLNLPSDADDLAVERAAGRLLVADRDGGAGLARPGDGVHVEVVTLAPPTPARKPVILGGVVSRM
jgi:hypothetical protein